MMELTERLGLSLSGLQSIRAGFNEWDGADSGSISQEDIERVPLAHASSCLILPHLSLGVVSSSFCEVKSQCRLQLVPLLAFVWWS